MLAYFTRNVYWFMWMDELSLLYVLILLMQRFNSLFVNCNLTINHHRNGHHHSRSTDARMLSVHNRDTSWQKERTTTYLAGERILPVPHYFQLNISPKCIHIVGVKNGDIPRVVIAVYSPHACSFSTEIIYVLSEDYFLNEHSMAPMRKIMRGWFYANRTAMQGLWRG